MPFTIKGGTPHGTKPLCATCEKATIVKGMRNEKVTLCHLFGRQGNYQGPVPFEVYERSDYSEKNRPSLHAMEQMAYIIIARKKGPPGFVAPEGTEKIEVSIRPPNKKKDEDEV